MGTNGMDEFKSLTEDEKKESLADLEDYDWTDNGGTEVRPIDSDSLNIEENKPIDPRLYEDLPPGIATPDHYHE